MRVLVVNAGSSSLKLRILDAAGATVAGRDLDSPEGRPDIDGLCAFLASDGAGIEASGHRVVHGGERFRNSAVVDEAVFAGIEEVCELAPLHTPDALEALVAIQQQLPEVPAVACFDTAFHATMPPEAAEYAVPREWRERFGMRRYGFHGLSHAYASRRAAELVERPLAELRTVTCHLGAGASLCAVAGGRSVDTTMGYTPLDGLVMATRSGALDPGAVLRAAEELSAERVEHALNEESGLLGLSGLSGDMRELLAAREGGSEPARIAVAAYIHRLRALVASMAAAMGGLDVLVFTGGVGENSAVVRAECCAGLGFLGVALDERANDDPQGDDADLTASGAAVRTLVIAAREEVEIAREVRALLSQ